MTYEKLVLLEIFSYSCMNCMRSLNYIKKLDKKYKKHGLKTILIHVPEWNFEKKITTVANAIKKNKIKLPVIVDKNKKIAKKFSINYLTSLKFNNIECTLFCTPPISHVNFALKAIENNSHVFVEKPLSNKLETISVLMKKANKRNLNIFVGYVFRFDKGLMKIKKELDNKRLGKIISFDAYEGWFLPKQGTHGQNLPECKAFCS